MWLTNLRLAAVFRKERQEKLCKERRAALLLYVPCLACLPDGAVVCQAVYRAVASLKLLQSSTKRWWGIIGEDLGSGKIFGGFLYCHLMK